MSTPGPGLTGQKPFSIGAVWADTLRVFSGNFANYLAVAMAIYLPIIVWYFVIAEDYGYIPVDENATFMQAFLATSSLLESLVTSVMEGLVYALLTVGAVVGVRGQSVDLRESLARGAPVAVTTTGALLAYYILAGIGFVLLIIPGIIAMVFLILTPTIAAFEGVGVGAALERSNNLTRGHRASIFGSLLMIGIVTILVAAILGSIFAAIEPLMFDASMTLAMPMFAVLSVCFGAALYVHLVEAKEGAPAEDMAKIFE